MNSILNYFSVKNDDNTKVFFSKIKNSLLRLSFEFPAFLLSEILFAVNTIWRRTSVYHRAGVDLGFFQAGGMRGDFELNFKMLIFIEDSWFSNLSVCLYMKIMITFRCFINYEVENTAFSSNACKRLFTSWISSWWALVKEVRGVWAWYYNC